MSKTVYVSIQLLLLFYSLPEILSFLRIPVSIQLLLLFYLIVIILFQSLFGFQYNSCYCSIPAGTNSIGNVNVFQYNSCYCSMSLGVFVNVDAEKVSIQLLLLFYLHDQECHWWILEFQYNSCYCSIVERCSIRCTNH